jgi:sec-independent protein translocase protein TatC
MAMTRKKKLQARNEKATPRKVLRAKATFMEHVAELRRRLFFIVLSIAIWSIAAYAVEHHVIDLLLAPAHGQKFIYTSPIGGMNFLFRVCIYVGIAFSIPVIVYHFLRYIEPLMKHDSASFIRLGSLASGVLAVGGMVFGYFVGLPAALHFLLNQFITNQIHPLLTIEAYLSFVTMYMLGAALMFQVPLIVLFINRIKPLTPQQLFRHERWFIVFAVVLGLIMNPTPNLIDQMFVIVPMILSYQLSIGIIWWHNRKHSRVAQMLDKDIKLQAARQQRIQDLRASWQTADALATSAETGLVAPKPVEVESSQATVPHKHSVASYTRRAPQAIQPRALRGRTIQ